MAVRGLAVEAEKPNIAYPPIEICLMVLPDILQSSVQQDPFGPQFFLHAFWVDGFIVPQHQLHHHDSKGRGPKFISNFQFPNAKMPKLQNCRSRETKEMCPPATIPSKM